MAMSGRTSKDKKTQKAKRQTMDRRMGRDIRLTRDVGERVEAPLRKATAAEVHADNNATYGAAYRLFNVKDRMNGFTGRGGVGSRGRGRSCSADTVN